MSVGQEVCRGAAYGLPCASGIVTAVPVDGEALARS